MYKLIFIFIIIFHSLSVFSQYAIPIVQPLDSSGKYISRSMNLLQKSTEEKKNTVRVLVYGQSISAQEWWLLVKEDLEKRFPNANLIMENRAIGGFASQMLWKTVKMDVLSFYPDLILFHVYGSHIDYPKVLEGFRGLTAAEVIIQTDHITKVNEAIDYKQHNVDLKSKEWSNKMCYKYIPDFAKEYKCDMALIRDNWMEYLSKNNYQPAEFLRDGVHLNDAGNKLLSQLLIPYIKYNPKYPTDPYQLDSMLSVPQNVQISGDTLQFEFWGNKVDAIFEDGNHNPADTLAILVDGKRPNEFQSTYVISRPYDSINGKFPWDMGCFYYTTNKKPLLKETWTCTITKINENHDAFEFEISGSKTGWDGKGKSSKKFVSNSQRVIIQPEDWHIKSAHRVTKLFITAGYKFFWDVKSLSVNTLIPQNQSDPSIENRLAMFQGIPNGKHKLVLVKKSSNFPAIKAFRIYQPYLGRNNK